LKKIEYHNSRELNQLIGNINFFSEWRTIKQHISIIIT